MHTKQPGVLPLTAAACALNTFSTAPKRLCQQPTAAASSRLQSNTGGHNSAPALLCREQQCLSPQQCHRSVQASATRAHSGPSSQDQLCHTQAARAWPGWQLMAFWAAVLTRTGTQAPLHTGVPAWRREWQLLHVWQHKSAQPRVWGQAAAGHDEKQEHAGRAAHAHTQLKT